MSLSESDYRTQAQIGKPKVKYGKSDEAVCIYHSGTHLSKSNEMKHPELPKYLVNVEHLAEIQVWPLNAPAAQRLLAETSAAIDFCHLSQDIDIWMDWVLWHYAASQSSDWNESDSRVVLYVCCWFLLTGVEMHINNSDFESAFLGVCVSAPQVAEAIHGTDRCLIQDLTDMAANLMWPSMPMMGDCIREYFKRCWYPNVTFPHYHMGLSCRSIFDGITFGTMSWKLLAAQYLK